MASFSTIKTVLVLIAMQAEAQPFIDKFQLLEETGGKFSGPSKSFKGKVGKMTVVVVTNGMCPTYSCDNVGTTPAAISAFSALHSYEPDIIINAGTAGGFKRVGGNVGDVYVCNEFKHHDRRIPIPGFEEYGHGHHHTLSVDNLVKALNFKSGVVTTSNALDHTEKDREIMLSHAADVKDMEAAGIAWVIEHCHPNRNHNVIPFFAIKVVTDIVDGDRATQEEFMENLHTASVSLQSALDKTINFISDKSIQQL